MPKSFSWGRTSGNSLISKFLDSKNARVKDATCSKNDLLAELWFGIHPNGTSKVLKSSLNGSSCLVPLPEILMAGGSGNDSLPYLAKILSVDNILSIQLHPDSEQAKVLNKLNSKEYPDISSKPEMGIALGELTLLCGFRTLRDCAFVFLNHPGFRSLRQAGLIKTQVISSSDIQENTLRELIREILDLSEEAINVFASSSFLEIRKDEYDEIAYQAYNYLLRLDPGMVILYFLNLFHYSKGEAIYIPPGVPHAYVYGELFECMKCSDNVVRGGLTGKYVDSENFSRLFVLDEINPKINPIIKCNGVLTFKHKGLPFVVTSIEGNQTGYEFPDNGSPQIIVVTAGNGYISLENERYYFQAGNAFLLNNPDSHYVITGDSLTLFHVTEGNSVTE